MADEVVQTQTEPPLGNDASARSQDGTILNQATKPETPETKPTSTETVKPEEKAAEGEKKPEAKTDGPPETYAEFKVPDGYKLDEAVSKEAGELFKEAGLTQDQAQKMVDLYVREAQKAFAQPLETYEAMKTDWRNEVVKDPKLGNGTDLLPDVKAGLGRMIDAIGGEAATAFRDAMALTGAGDHPAVIRGLYALAQLVTEGRPVKAGAPVTPKQAQPPTGAKALYPNLS